MLVLVLTRPIRQYANGCGDFNDDYLWCLSYDEKSEKDYLCQKIFLIQKMTAIFISEDLLLYSLSWFLISAFFAQDS